MQIQQMKPGSFGWNCLFLGLAVVATPLGWVSSVIGIGLAVLGILGGKVIEERDKAAAERKKAGAQQDQQDQQNLEQAAGVTPELQDSFRRFLEQEEGLENAAAPAQTASDTPASDRIRRMRRAAMDEEVMEKRRLNARQTPHPNDTVSAGGSSTGGNGQQKRRPYGPGSGSRKF